MSPKLKRVSLYVVFAVIATLLNLGAQRLVLGVIDPHYGLLPAMIIGTAVGLIAKYLLDKRWVFEDLSEGLAENGRKFGLYTAMGLITTLLFWATEYAFWLVGQTDMMREMGAVVGLAMGYAVKYMLDRRYVFTSKALTA